MLATVLDRLGGRLGLPNTWERRTRRAVLEAYGVITNPKDQPPILTASAHRFEPAAVHAPTGWMVVFPRKRDERQLRWLEFSDGRLVLQTGVLRRSVWLETRIYPRGAVSLGEVFESQICEVRARASDIEEHVRTPPSDDGLTPGELSFGIRRNGAPQRARMLMLGVADHVIEVFYDAPERLSETARSLADEAVAIGLEAVRSAEDEPEFDPEAFADALRSFGMSEEEIAQAVKEEAGRPLFDRP